MRKISESVRKAVFKFVEQGQSFNSLDIYCVLGVRINDLEYPIYEQVWDMYKNREMPSYLSQFVRIDLECGGYANVWRYYRPTSEFAKYPTFITKDGRLEVTRDALGHFPLLNLKLGCVVEDGRLVLRPHKDTDTVVYDPQNRVKISASIVKQAGLNKAKNIEIHSFLNRIEIIGLY